MEKLNKYTMDLYNTRAEIYKTFTDYNKQCNSDTCVIVKDSETKNNKSKVSQKISDNP